jgi:hypothetical protein
MTNEFETIDNDFIQLVMNEYDVISEATDFQYPQHIRAKIKKQYEDKLSLPSSLAVEIVECRNDCCVKV